MHAAVENSAGADHSWPSKLFASAMCHLVASYHGLLIIPLCRPKAPLRLDSVRSGQIAMMLEDSAAVLDAKAKRRLKERQKMQRYRKRLVDKASFLKEQVRRLEEHLQSQTKYKRASQSLLPWDVVADVFREETAAATVTTASLRSQCLQYEEMIHTMKAWVRRTQGMRDSALTTNPSGVQKTWRNVSLPVHPSSRRLGADWITQYLYHNTDRTLHQLAFPTTDVDDFADFNIDGSNPDCFQYIWRSQRHIPASLEHVREVFARPNIAGQVRGSYMGDKPPVEAVQALVATDNQLFHGLDTVYVHNLFRPHSLVSFLSREFNDPTRCVFVAQNIHDDEAIAAKTPRQRNRMIWLVLDRLGPDLTRMRALCINSHGFDDAGYLSLADEAKGWGVDIDRYPPTMQEAMFAHHVTQVASRNGGSFARELRDRLSPGYVKIER